MKDLFGKAILDYQTNNLPQSIITSTSISDEDELSVAYLFRNYKKMPKIEQHALELCFGNVLDVGCGAGSHSLYLENEKKLNVTAIDISKNAITTCKLRGLKNAENIDVFDIKNKKFDTILLLMNGAGMCGKLKKLPAFLKHLKNLLNSNGQILLDSSDIIYMFDEDEDGAKIVPANVTYYGEVTYYVKYKGEKEKPFKWMYIDFNRLKFAAESVGLQCQLEKKGKHYDYLAKLTHSI